MIWSRKDIASAAGTALVFFVLVVAGVPIWVGLVFGAVSLAVYEWREWLGPVPHESRKRKRARGAKDSAPQR